MGCVLTTPSVIKRRFLRLDRGAKIGKFSGKLKGETWFLGVIFASGCGWAGRKKSSKRKKLKNILIIFYNIYNIIIY